jgi:aspartyl-tRNA synthetase
MFRSFLKSENFTEIHSPKLQGTTTETDGSVFKVAYFQGDAFLAQTPQFAKQMAIAADFERVFEIGSVFRANDNTHRHLTEFVALDLEMTIEEHYHEVVELLDSLFLYIFRGLRDKYRHEIDVVGKQFPSEAFKWREGSEGTLKLKWPEALALLRDAGEDVNEWNEDAQGNKVKTEQDIHDLRSAPHYWVLDRTHAKCPASIWRGSLANLCERHTRLIISFLTNSRSQRDNFTQCLMQPTQ